MQNWRANQLTISVAADDPKATKRTFNNLNETITVDQVTVLGQSVATLVAAPFTGASLKTTRQFSF
ncbi:hypothetical protein C5Z25_10975 [Lactobacillus sp. CBA3605]|uniref:DUF1659 domain-containing protein n=1 Tax=Lactobacillus sp. CBA3605 TaxID=2099788 RepID=UPI000CFAEAF0|nr:hypothetical protein [Lactobacillus sp. CBA3605]AVK62262.1 hypothetical protein C5Z25_10975 [Lactobacillus sp. CBA3605]